MRRNIMKAAKTGRKSAVKNNDDLHFYELLELANMSSKMDAVYMAFCGGYEIAMRRAKKMQRAAQ